MNSLRFLSLYLFSFFLRCSASPTKFGDPFLKSLNSSTWVIGNDIWNLTIAMTYGTKLMYKGHDLVGNAVGHYVSYSMSFKLWPTPRELDANVDRRWRGQQSQLDIS